MSDRERDSAGAVRGCRCKICRRKRGYSPSEYQEEESGRQWWHAIGSPDRHAPRWKWQRRHYTEGLRDAARIMEDVRRLHWHDMSEEARSVIAAGLKLIHDRSMKFQTDKNK